AAGGGTATESQLAQATTPGGEDQGGVQSTPGYQPQGGIQSTPGYQPQTEETQPGTERMPRPMSPLLRLPPRREAGGEYLIEEPTEDVSYVEPERGETVASRVRPELEPFGVRVGSFLFFPWVTGEEEFNSNIFATPDDEKSDLIHHVEPGFILDSNWNRHRLTLRADADLGFYTDNDSEDFKDYRAGVAGRLDVMRGAYLTGSADYKHLHEERSSPDDVGGSEPTEFDDIALRAAYVQQFGRFRARLLGSFDALDFQDVPAGGGGTIDNDDRDRYEAEGTLRVGYEIVPDYETYVQGSYNMRDYQRALDDNGFNRDSHGFAADAGVEVDFGGILFGDFFVGYRQQEYSDPAFDTIDGLDAGATLTWNVTPLTTVVGTVKRSIGETIQSGSAGYTGTELDLSIDHELLRNLILGLDVTYINRDYDGIDRSDDVYQAGIDANYMMNRNIYVTASYQYTDRRSTVGDAEYSQHIALVGLKLQY
ncbi:MAG: outer membrane beta-barrel protein, partial [Rhodospirillaceae bacterium]|nr:outer membrane beta-barrel protein [Rhodospirillaceae bacterium]